LAMARRNCGGHGFAPEMPKSHENHLFTTRRAGGFRRSSRAVF